MPLSDLRLLCGSIDGWGGESRKVHPNSTRENVKLVSSELDWAGRRPEEGWARAEPGTAFSKETGKSFDTTAIDNWWGSHKKKGKTAV